MGFDINRVTLLGRLGVDPELRHTAGGTAVCNFRMATSYKPKDREELTDWHNVVIWGRSAEMAADQLRKGDRVLVEGRITTRQWEDKDGNRRNTTEIVANAAPDKIAVGNVANSSGGSGYGSSRDEPPAMDDSDVPF